MEIHTINTAEEFLVSLNNMKDSRAWAFRGQGASSWSLLPKSGRSKFSSKYSKTDIDEKTIFNAWKRYAIQFVKIVPENDWDWLSLAQHHGLATRLLDWTKNPLNAAFFAVDSAHKEDCSIYAFKIRKSDITDIDDPFRVRGVKVYYPRGITERVVSQRGIFTISSTPNVPIEEKLTGRLHKYIIKMDVVDEIKQQLDFLGINSLSIYQDLDNLSNYLNDVVLSNYTKSTSDLLLLNK